MLPGNYACRKRTDDAGFTLVEILVASAIMFFVATALFGLVSTSTLLSVTAKADAVAVNAANSFLEQVRQLAYTDVTQTRINALAAASSRTIDGIAVSVTATVTPQWFAEQNREHEYPAYKHVAVTIRAIGPAGRPFVLTTGTFVSNLLATGTIGGSGGSGGGGGEATEVVEPAVPRPTVNLTDSTPRGGAVRGASVPLGMTARSGGSGVTLIELEISGSGDSILEKLTTLPEDSLSGNWDTTAMNLDGTQRFPDGTYEMRATARDSRGQLTALAWSLTVDNNPPNPPGTPTLRSTVNNTQATFDWTPARDGNDWVREYLVEWQIQSLTAGSFTTLGTPQVVTPADPTSLVTWAGNTSAFNRYRINVVSRGPIAQGQTAPHFTGGPVSATFISRPSFTATSTSAVIDEGRPNRRAIFNINLGINPPAFQVAGSVNYRWQFRYSLENPVIWRELAATTAPNFSSLPTNWMAPVNGRFNDGSWIEFRCLVTVTPSGGSEVRVPSSVVRFTRTGTSLSRSEPGGAWSRWPEPLPSGTPAIDWRMWGL